MFICTTNFNILKKIADFMFNEKKNTFKTKNKTGNGE